MKNFLQQVLLLIKGELPDYNAHLRLVQKYMLLEKELKLSEEMRRAEAVRRRATAVPIAGFDTLEYEPTDTKERLAYAARVDEFYEDILKNKIRVSVSEIRELLAAGVIDRALPETMTREQYDFLLRGMEAGLWKIHDWATVLQGELKQAKNNESI